MAKNYETENKKLVVISIIVFLLGLILGSFNIYTNLKTNADGEITLNNILPGTYYIRETKAKYGYIKHSELTKIEIKLNEKAIIEFENIKKSKPNITINEKEIKVSYEEEEKQKENINKEKSTIIKKLPVTGM